MAGSSVDAMFHFLGNCQAVFYSGCIITHPHQQILIVSPILPLRYVSLVGRDDWSERQKTQVLVLPQIHCEIILITASISCVCTAPGTVLRFFIN